MYKSELASSRMCNRDVRLTVLPCHHSVDFKAVVGVSPTAKQFPRFRLTLRKAAATAWIVFVSLVVTPAVGYGSTNRYPDADDDFALAANQYSLGNWERAVTAFQSLIDDYPEHPRAQLSQFFLGEALVQLGQYEQAHQAFQRFIDHGVESEYTPQAVYRVGETAFLISEPQTAFTWLTRFHSENPAHPLNAYALPYLGDVSLELNDDEQAVQRYTQTLQEFPESALADHCRLGLAQIHDRNGDATEAIRFLAHLMDQSETLADIATFESIRIQRQLGNQEEVDGLVQRYLTDYPEGECAATCRFLESESLWQNGELEGAIQAATLGMEGLVENESGRELMKEIAPGIIFQLGIACWQRLDYDRAERMFDEIGRSWSESDWADDASEMLIRKYLLEQRYEELNSRASEFRVQYSDSPLLPFVLELSGRAAYAQEKLETAEISFREAWQHGQEADVRPEFMANILYLHALSLIALERPAEAIDQLTIAMPFIDLTNQQADLDSPPSPLRSGTYLAMAVAHQAMGDIESAVTARYAFLDLEGQGADVVDCLCDLTHELIELERYDHALESLVKLRDLSPQHSEWEALTGSLAEDSYNAEDWKTSLEAFRLISTFSTSDEKRIKSLVGIGWVHYSSEEYDDAIAAFEQATAQGETGTTIAEAKYMLGRIHEYQGDDITARNWYQQVETTDPNSEYRTDSLLRSARIGKESDDPSSLESALGEYERLIALQPESLGQDLLLYERAWLLRKLDRNDEYLDTCRQITTEHPDSIYWADAAYRVAEHLTSVGTRDEATRLLSEIINRDPTHELACYSMYLLGQDAANQRSWEGVIRYMSEVRTHPNGNALASQASYWLGEAYFQTSEYANAREAYLSLLNAEDASQLAWEPTLNLRVAQIDALAGEWAVALSRAEKIIEQQDELSQPYELDYLIGRCYSSLGRFDEARTAYGRVLESPYGNRSETAAKAQWMIGESHFHQEQFDEAIDAFERVEILFAYPVWQSAALLQAAKCHEQAGRPRDAIKLYAKLLRDYPDSEYTIDATERLQIVQQQVIADQN